jgi:predicted nucleic acid-binding protein
MKTLFDTSIIVAGIVEAHPKHSRAFILVRQAKDREFELVVAAHTIAESYAVLSSLPIKPKISPLAARKLLRDNIEPGAELVALTPAEYLETVSGLSEAGLAGGIVYDALIARAAQKAGIERLVTLNPEDFVRIWPAGREIIVGP